METIFVKGRIQGSRIFAGESIENLSAYLPASGVFIITDSNLNRLYCKSFPDCPVFVTEPGEDRKTTETVLSACRWLLDKGAGRDSFILGIGGGIVCDIAGFTASVFMRGVRFGFVATSLLAQVDASVGGKNGVNLDGYKNIIGCFNQPDFVICDTEMLESLPAGEMKNGLAEAVKHTLIDNRNMFRTIWEHADEITGLKSTVVLSRMISHSVNVKADIVNRDEVELGERRKLNLGHTWGHALEKITGMSHGRAVSIGLVFAARLSEYKGLLKPEARTRITELLSRLGLPTSDNTDPMQVLEALLKDKKRESDHIHFVLIKGIGEVVVEALPIKWLRAFVEKYRHEIPKF